MQPSIPPRHLEHPRFSLVDFFMALGAGSEFFLADLPVFGAGGGVAIGAEDGRFFMALAGRLRAPGFAASVSS